MTDKPSPIINETLRFATSPGHPQTRIYQTVCSKCGPVGVSENETMNRVICHGCGGSNLQIIRDVISEKYPGMLMERGKHDA